MRDAPRLRRPAFAGAVLAACLGLLCAEGSRAHAAELASADCERLKAENAQLVQQGVPKLMEKGPEWARANLDPDRLASIRRLIEVSEQIMFRCEKLRPINTRVEDVDGEGADSTDEPHQGAAAASDKASSGEAKAKPPGAAAKAKTAQRTKPAAEDAGDDEAAARPKSAAAKPAKRPAQPKSNDAYVPKPVKSDEGSED